jgi:hypothetical protein
MSKTHDLLKSSKFGEYSVIERLECVLGHLGASIGQTVRHIQNICKICKQYADFDVITLNCMQYAKYAKKICTIFKISKRHFQYAALPTLLMALEWLKPRWLPPQAFRHQPKAGP